MKLETLNADRTGLEPATSAVTGRHSNQLNYRSFQSPGAGAIQVIFGTAKIGVGKVSTKIFFKKYAPVFQHFG